MLSIRPRYREIVTTIALAFMFSLSGVRAQAPPNANHREQKADPVAMTVGGRAITVSELCTAIESLPPPQRKGYALQPNLAAQWFGPLAAMADEARREGLSVPKDPKESEVDLDNALAGELIRAIALKTQPTDREIESYYAAHNAEFEQAKVRHILISDATAFASRSQRSAAEAKVKAEDLGHQLKQGRDFAALAEKESDDPYTKEKGGDLGYVSHHQVEPSVDAAIWKLKGGETSAPFEGRFGYEIVQVQEKRTQPLEAVKETIVGRMKSSALDKRQQEIVSAAHVTLDENYRSSPLPCHTSQPFTLKDSLQGP